MIDSFKKELQGYGLIKELYTDFQPQPFYRSSNINDTNNNSDNDINNIQKIPLSNASPWFCKTFDQQNNSLHCSSKCGYLFAASSSGVFITTLNALDKRINQLKKYFVDKVNENEYENNDGDNKKNIFLFDYEHVSNPENSDCLFLNFKM